MTHMASHSAAEMVRRYIRRLKVGAAFTPAELIRERLGSERAIRETLRRMASDGTIRRIAKGYYDVPRTSPHIGVLSPSPEAIIAAHGRKTGATIERPEVDAANKLGLTTQVPAKPVYRTNLFSRDLYSGGQSIHLRTVGPRSLAQDAGPSELIIDALASIGKRHITPSDISTLSDFVRAHGLQRELMRRAQRAPTWMIRFLDEIVKKD